MSRFWDFRVSQSGKTETGGLLEKDQHPHAEKPILFIKNKLHIPTLPQIQLACFMINTWHENILSFRFRKCPDRHWNFSASDCFVCCSSLVRLDSIAHRLAHDRIPAAAW